MWSLSTNFGTLIVHDDDGNYVASFDPKRLELAQEMVQKHSQPELKKPPSIDPRTIVWESSRKAK